jgi:hypothetical protein
MRGWLAARWERLLSKDLLLPLWEGGDGVNRKSGDERSVQRAIRYLGCAAVRAAPKAPSRWVAAWIELWLACKNMEVH